VMEGREATCHESVKEELKGVGAEFREGKVVVDGNLITSKGPDDLQTFMDKLLEKIKDRSES